MFESFKRTVLIFVMLAVFVDLNASRQSVYNILYVQSYTENDTWSKELSEGLIKGFRENSFSVNLTVEYLNSRLLNSEQEEEKMRRFCRDAAERGTDLIVVSHDEALYSLLKCGDPLPSQIPVVYFGVEFPNQPLMSNFNNIAGTTSPHPYDVMLSTAKKVFPERNIVVLVGEDTTLGRMGAEAFQSFWKEFPEKESYELKIYNATNDPLTDILNDIQISYRAPKSIMIVPYWGLYMSSISKVSRAPTFTVSGTSLLNGVFCAVGPDMYKDARNAAKIACRILSGEPPSSIPLTQSEHQLTFDYKQLNFFNIKKDQLPRNSIIINEPYIDKYGVLIFLFYSLVLGLLIFIVVRLIMIYRREARRRMQAQTKLLVQNRLIAQRNEFDHIFHSIRDAVVTYDTDFRIHFVNKTLLQMLNIQEDMDENSSRPFEGQEAPSLFGLYNNGEDILIPLLKQVSKEGVSIDIPENSFIKDTYSKNYFPVSGEIAPLYEKDKQTGLVLNFRNISEVAMQKHFFSLAVEESSIYPWQYSKTTETFIFPANYMNDLGFEGRTLLPREEMNQYIHPDDLDGTTIGFSDILAGKKHSTRLSFRQRNKSGKYEWWEFRISVLSGLTVDSPYSILGVCQSIQRYKTTEEELIAARDHALQADKLKTAFLANMSHEIRTPLNAIVGFSDLLKEYNMFSESEIQEFITTINKNCELLLTLINDILDLSKVEAGGMDFQYSPYYLPLIIQEIYDSQKLAMAEDVELIQLIPENSDRTIVTDIVRLKQVLNNLINNAAKFTPKGSIVFGYTEEETHYTTFFVKDTGTGISRQNLERIFERFYKVDSFTQGAGLGLSISQTIVNRLRGTIHVTSEEGMGTCFTVRIPNDIVES